MSQLEALAGSLRAHEVEGAELALVLGSGLGVFAERLENARVIPYAELASMPRSTVPGHAGQLVVGRIAGHRVVCQQGRVHLYEGWSAEEVTRAVRAFAALGCRGVLLTNAAGGLRLDWQPGSLMRLTDHWNRQSTSPLGGADRGCGSPYDPRLAQALDEAAAETEVTLHSGVYAANLGPAYETPAEVRMLAEFGADAVGMSTACEALAASAAGMRVAAVSCITNHASGLTDEVLDHADVVEVGKRASKDFCALVEAAVPRLCSELKA